MYCPNDECPDFVAYGVRGEYREGIATCPRCGAHLLPGSPAAVSKSSAKAGERDSAELQPEGAASRREPRLEDRERFVPVAKYDFEHEANVAVSFLASAGIDAIVTGDDCGRTDPILGFVTGGLRLMVPESQAQKAAELLESSRATEEQGPD